ncbi:hypothetical protein BN7_2725 [Wickerhamomyces ciferrii]|uniref:Uncharacterized protein n=1 Tax=Wickerhamomyces ciferrii (strain ATCC 14091 / BCRC 22168 / CBS 111 / JCM 3599 / NBRC 0793 / NRRL Y-1031 F-60-10) TaxID=1206466 RepID=K0KPT3_WICCF|nr:uncharacterized protein BN7_2725 [Wickerhamomyces ciferrii]CCH43178.1 hypothetical protein BN7_2725 [Wickerhamomyces ciferrii]
MRSTPQVPSYKSYYKGPVVIRKPGQDDAFQKFIAVFKKKLNRKLYPEDTNDYNDLIARFFISQPLYTQKLLIDQLNQNLKKRPAYENLETSSLIAEFDDSAFMDDIMEMCPKIQIAMEEPRDCTPVYKWLDLVVEPNRDQIWLSIENINRAQIDLILFARVINPLLHLLVKIYGEVFFISLQQPIQIIDSVSRGFSRPNSLIEIDDLRCCIPFKSILKLPDADKINEANLLELNGVGEALEYMVNCKSRIGILSNFKTTVLLGFIPGSKKLHYKAISHKAENLTVLGALLTIWARAFENKNKYGKVMVGDLNKCQVNIISKLIGKHKVEVAKEFKNNIQESKGNMMSNSRNAKTVTFSFKQKKRFDKVFKWFDNLNFNKFDQHFQTFAMNPIDYNRFFGNQFPKLNKDEAQAYIVEINALNLAKYDRLVVEKLYDFQFIEDEIYKEYNAIIQEYEKIKALTKRRPQKIYQRTNISNGYLEIKVKEEFAICGPFIAHLRKPLSNFNHDKYKAELRKQLKLLHKNKMSIKNRASFSYEHNPTKLNPADVTINSEGNYCFKFPNGLKFTPEQDIEELEDLLKNNPVPY